MATTNANFDIRPQRWRPTRRGVGLVLVGTLGLTGLAACGSSSHAHVSAPPPRRPTTTTVPRTTTTTVPPIVAPLTGLPATAAVAHQMAVVVKIDNVEEALPQTGVGNADVVYEEMVEGGLTRLAAVFQSDYPTVVGPVRSGRLTDEGIGDDLNDPVLAYAGTNGIFQPLLEAQPMHLVTADNYPNLYYRAGSQAAPHNLFSNVAAMAATVSAPTPPPPLWAFAKPDAPFSGAGVKPPASVAIGFPAASVTWNWNAHDGLWLRSQDGAVDTDSNGVQLSTSNVIIEWVPYVTSAYVSGEGAAAEGAPIPTGEQVGSGTAWFLSDGRIVVGTWTRSSLTSPAVYADSLGKPIKLRPGRTWVELPEVGAVATVTP